MDNIKTIENLKKEVSLLKAENFKLHQYKDAIEESNIVSIGDLDGNIKYVNDKFSECTFYTKEEVLNKPHSILRGDASKEVFVELWETIKNKKTWQGILKNKRKNGEPYYINTTIKPILNQEGEIEEFMAIRHEITNFILKSKELEKSLKEDFLTKQGNRFKLLEDIKKTTKPSLALFDINRFAEINNFYGHDIGDEILIILAKIFKCLIPTNYSLYRVYSDEFAILADNEDKNMFISTMDHINKEISSFPIKLHGKEFYIQLTYSMSFEPKETIKKTANMIKKYSKLDRNITVYDRSLGLEKIYEKNILWTLKVKKALDNDKIVPFFQPIYNLKTQKIEKYESLVRLIDEEDITISPYYFLENAKKSHQYVYITKRMIRKTFDYFKDKDFEFSINLTIEDIVNEKLTLYILTKLKEYNIGSKVVFEIVESEGINNFEEINSFIAKVKKLGCKIAIDDFGSGYSNFSYLIKLKADYIKIDGSLIKDIISNKNNKEIVITILDFARRQGFKTIAEFVSNEKIFKEVKDLGFDYAQGYYLGEPKKDILA